MQPFKAYLIEQDEHRKVSGRMATLAPDQLDPGEVLIRVHYSSINYKDALAATGTGKIIRRFPCAGGIDLSGEVVESSDDRFRAGDRVIATSYDIGVAHHGGYAEYARIPAGWVIPLPQGLDLHEAMGLGTAGFTAALGIVRMEDNGLAPDNGPVVVTGATGGVGGLAIDMLARRGYHVAALTGKETETDYLRELGAPRSSPGRASTGKRCGRRGGPLGRAAIDSVGSHTLANACAGTKAGGAVAACGNAQGMDLPATVAPFILRGVSLLGIDSGYMGEPTRSRVWQRLAGDLKPRRLAGVTRTIDFDQLPGAFDDYIKGRVKGRTVVRIGA